MKRILFLTPLALATALIFTGCGDCSTCGSHGGGDAAATSAPLALDTSSVEKAFASAEASVKSTADKAIAAVKRADYSAALSEAQRLINDVKLTPQQKESLAKLVEQVKSSAADTATKLGTAAQQTADELKKALPAAK
jgi:hypothetical protein